MSEQRNKVSVERAESGDVEYAMHALAGLFRALDAIGDGGLKEQLDEETLRNTKHSLVIAGRLIAEDVLRRL